MRDLGVLACIAAAAACNNNHKPEADPARITALMKKAEKNGPSIGDVRECKPNEMIGGATMTQLTLVKLADVPPTPGAERDDWINPAELDSPAARELIDPKADDTTKRQAAYELLSAPFYLVYRVDVVAAPMAIGIKDLRRGLVNMTAVRYDRQGTCECATPVSIQNTLDKTDWSIAKSNLAVMDPKVSAVLRDDLHAQMLKHVAALGRPPAKP